MQVAIIGGGFSGVSVAVQLAQQTKKRIHIVLFNAGYPLAQGAAYSTHHPMHVLNVAAGRMSFFNDEPLHFVNWITQKHAIEFLPFEKTQLEDAFVPRSVYAEYIIETLNRELIFNSHVNYTLVEEEVTDFLPDEDKLTIITASGKKTSFDKIIIATGNEPPATPSFIPHNLIEQKIYSGNPWLTQTKKLNNNTETVLLLGTGLTMIDNMLSVFGSGFKGKIVALSSRGLLPLPHRKSETDYAILKELKKPYDINTVFDTFRKHVHRVRNYGLSGVAVVDALRPLTQEIWKEITVADKKRFLLHLRTLWGVARHRLPLHIHDTMNGFINTNRLQIIAGRLIRVELDGNTAIATVKLRQTEENIKVTIQKIINCTGPLLDITKSNSALLKNLLAKKTICADELKLGVKATSDGSIIGADGVASKNIFTLGPLLKGVLWESSAVPEIRKQAQELAAKILN